VPSEQEALVDRLGRYPVARYPVQHATTQFHLGAVLLHAGHPAAARDALAVAREVFDGAGMRLERAKAATMLGVALRETGGLPEAAEAFREAATEFAALTQPVEGAAASYDLGLVCRDRGDIEGAHAAWTRARALFLDAGHPARAAAAARDYGASLLTSGDVTAALLLLQEAATLAERAGDLPGLGAAANAVGLAHLAADDALAAVEAFRRAVGAFPRTVHPAEYAMAKANLALAHDRWDQPAHARLAARQALATPAAARPVRSLARDVLRRMPPGSPEDLLVVLDAEDPQRRPAVLREEVVRLGDVPAAERCDVIRVFLDGLLTRPGSSYELAASLLGVLLELPPVRFAEVIAAVVQGTGDRADADADRVRAVVGSALARFPVPQWQRVAATLNESARAAGQPAVWR